MGLVILIEGSSGSGLRLTLNSQFMIRWMCEIPEALNVNVKMSELERNTSLMIFPNA